MNTKNSGVEPTVSGLGSFALDHVSFRVSDLRRSGQFYDAVLAPLRLIRVWSTDDAIGYGYPGRDDALAIKAAEGSVATSHSFTHLAFRAPDRTAVAGFHAAGIERGATDEGPPGLCPEYGDGYYAAFLRDPDGYRIEAVLHETR